MFQLWYASPLPFTFGIGILNDTEARSLHLAFALFLAFAAWPAWKRSPRTRVPALDWVLAIAGAFAGAYLLLFYRELSLRPGQTTTMDIVVSVMGLVLLLEATRRSVGWPMALLAVLFIAYAMGGPYLPDVLAHKGASVSRLMSHLWLTTEGVFGIALGVSTGTIFVYVLFGTLLDRAGGGNYMMQVSFAALGHMRGGPAKVAVVSSALNGIISGSSVSNVVSGGIFTIPLMKKSGYGGVKAGAIETMSIVNGQIMPPVMGAAAFLMVEYVGIPYSEIVKNAILPATLSYIGLFYIVHLEALKLRMEPLIRRDHRPWTTSVLRTLLGLSGTVAVCCVLYYLLAGINVVLGSAAGMATIVVVGALYVFSVWAAAKSPDLPPDIDVENPNPLETWPAVKAGLHFILPIGMLIWCLMIEELSPSLSAFWAIVMLVVLMLTQRPLIDFFRGTKTRRAWTSGLHDVLQGMNDGSRNMIGIGVATATAGVIVGGITLTGLGLRMTEFVEFVSQGNVMAMLLFIAFVCLVLGLGVPTTANYVLVATLMAPVVVELGAQAGLVIPLIAVHLFVFYYGIMGDITPPVGLATFAAAAISGEDAIATGVQGSVYALRTVILPFIWIFNPQLLLIDIDSVWELASRDRRLDRGDARVRGGDDELVPRQVPAVGDRAARDRLRAAVPARLLHGLPRSRVQAPAGQGGRRGREEPAGRRPSRDGDQGHDDRRRRRDQDRRRPARCRRPTTAASASPRRDSRSSTLGDATQISGVKFGSRAKKSGFEQGWDVAADRGAVRPADAALVLPAGARAGRAGLVVAGPPAAGETYAPSRAGLRRANWAAAAGGLRSAAAHGHWPPARRAVSRSAPSRARRPSPGRRDGRSPGRRPPRRP